MCVRALTRLLVAAAVALGGCGGSDAAPPPPPEQAKAPAAAFPTVSPAQVAPDVRAGRTLLVDVREDREWQVGRAPGAMHVPLADVERRLGEIRARARGRRVAFVCRTGRRSAQAAAIAVAGGLVRVLNVDGGMSAWVRAGLPLVPRDGRVA